MTAHPLSRSAYGLVILALLIASLVAWRDGTVLFMIGVK